MQCAECPRRALGDFAACGARGELSADLLIVGMAPGHEELAQQVPFVGGSGRILARVLRDAGLSIERIRITNVINCYPLAKGDKISPEQLKACSARFVAEMLASEARVVFCLGADALFRVAGMKGEITKWRGHLLSPSDCVPPVLTKGKEALPLALPSRCEWVIPSLHPAFIMRGGLRPLPMLAEDTKRVARALRNDLCIVSVGGAGDAIAPCVALPGPIACDIETDSAGAIDRIGLASITNGTISSGSWPWSGAARAAATDALGDPRTTKVFHHAGFDIEHLANAGCEVRGKLWDTMWAGQMIQPDLDKNLDTMSSLYLDIPRWKHKRLQDEAVYNRLDVHATLAMVAPQRECLAEQGQLSLFEDVVMPMLPVLIGMKRRGVRIDTAKRDEIAKDLERRVLTHKARFETIAPGVNPGSPTQLKKLLYEKFGLPAQYKAEQITTEKTALKKLLKRASGESQIALETLLELRAASKLLSVYIGATDTVHPAYFPVGKDDATYGTATGRLSCQDPNIQQVPKKLRSMYVPHTPDLVFVSADYDQIELRIAAVLSDDLALLSALEHDVHAHNMVILRCDRTRAKNVMYGYLYGAGPKKLWETLLGAGFEVTLAECKAMVLTLQSAYPRLAAWRKEVVRQAQATCKVVSPFNRVRYFYDPSNAVPEIINFVPQATAADILASCVPDIELLASRLGGHLCMLVHDDATIEVAREYASRAALALREVMQRTFDCVAPGFSVPVKVSIGENWGEMT